MDSDTDHPMQTPPTNSPPSSGDERSPPGSPTIPTRTTQLSDLGAGVLTQVHEYLDGDSDQKGKKQREEREKRMAAEAEHEKLVHKEWKEAWSKKWQDDFDESFLKKYSMSSATTPTTSTGTAGKAPESGKQ